MISYRELRSWTVVVALHLLQLFDLLQLKLLHLGVDGGLLRGALGRLTTPVAELGRSRACSGVFEASLGALDAFARLRGRDELIHLQGMV